MAVVAIATSIVLMLAAVSAKGASLALVLALDVSASVSADSYVLQRDGIARAFGDPRLAEAISAAPGGIEVLVLEWSDPDKIAVTVDWTPVADAAGAKSFAAAVTFDHLPEPAARRMIDISGDGIANFGLPPAVARDRILARGIAINGLAILIDERGLADYYRTNVIGGLSAFVAVARTFDDFAVAMLQKLEREV